MLTYSVLIFLIKKYSIHLVCAYVIFIAIYKMKFYSSGFMCKKAVLADTDVLVQFQQLPGGTEERNG